MELAEVPCYFSAGNEHLVISVIIISCLNEG